MRVNKIVGFVSRKIVIGSRRRDVKLEVLLCMISIAAQTKYRGDGLVRCLGRARKRAHHQFRSVLTYRLVGEPGKDVFWSKAIWIMVSFSSTLAHIILGPARIRCSP